jgi:hypothetical protein
MTAPTMANSNTKPTKGMPAIQKALHSFMANPLND